MILLNSKRTYAIENLPNLNGTMASRQWKIDVYWMHAEIWPFRNSLFYF